jgi:glycolate oxidase iron-sulfur subunit
MLKANFMATDGIQAEESSPLDDLYIPSADECRQCGMCDSTCPTFRLTPIDAETPRQRLRSIDKILNDHAISDEERQHLDHCLQCRACESRCPSQVEFGKLFDIAQNRLQTAESRPWMARIGFALIAHKRWRQLLLPWISLYLRSGLRKPLRASGILDKLNLAEAERLASHPSLTKLAGIYPAKKRKIRGRVALFTGCLSEHFDRATHLATIKILNTLGYEVVVPEHQSCCGAIHQHHGLSAQALIDNNIAEFYALEVEAVLYNATGCGAMLSEYRNHDEETSGWFRNKQQDVHQFLLAHWPSEIIPAASNIKVAVHEPCSQRNVLKNTQAVYDLLRKIPGLDVKALSNNDQCCGAGGTYMLSHPDKADQFRQAKRTTINQCGADLVVSSNFGCSLYMNANRRNDEHKLLHPLQLLADRL